MKTLLKMQMSRLSSDLHFPERRVKVVQEKQQQKKDSYDLWKKHQLLFFRAVPEVPESPRGDVVFPKKLNARL